jgi:hypothetical protein
MGQLATCSGVRENKIVSSPLTSGAIATAPAVELDDPKAVTVNTPSPGK